MKIVIFSGYNTRGVVAFIRTLENLGLPYFIVAKSKNDPIFLTKYGMNELIHIRSTNKLSVMVFAYIIATIRKKIDVDSSHELFIAPSSEYLNRFLLKNRCEIEGMNVNIPLVSESLYNSISNKESFIEICQKFGVITPKRLSHPIIPSVCKPKYYCSSTGRQLKPYLIETSEDLEHVLKTAKFRSEYFVQEFVAGKSFYLLYYFFKDHKKEPVQLSQQNFIQQCQGGSILAAKTSNVHLKTISTDFKNMLVELKFHGLIMIEVKEQDSRFIMIEANPRFWGPSQLFVDAEINLFEAFLQDNNLVSNLTFPTYHKDAWYFWDDGMSIRAIGLKTCAKFHNYSLLSFELEEESWNQADLLNRADTLGLKQQTIDSGKLCILYNSISKHSNYQILHPILKDLINPESLQTRSRFEQERFNYICKNVKLNNQHVVDVGCNTGFFAFGSVQNDANIVRCFEGNKNHCEFVTLAAELAGMTPKIKVFNEYYDFNVEDNCRGSDVMFLLNVLHHVGDDFSESVDSSECLTMISKYLKNIARTTKRIVLQLGFNWKGKVELPLFANGTKTEMIAFVEQSCRELYSIDYIGIAERVNDQVVYRDISETNTAREDSLGEFLNRPLFILSSKYFVRQS